MVMMLLVLLPLAFLEVRGALGIHEVLVQGRLRVHRLRSVAYLSNITATLAVLGRHARQLAHGLERNVQILLNRNMRPIRSMVAHPPRIPLNTGATMLRMVPGIGCILIFSATIFLVTNGLALDLLHLFLQAHWRALVLQA